MRKRARQCAHGEYLEAHGGSKRHIHRASRRQRLQKEVPSTFRSNMSKLPAVPRTQPVGAHLNPCSQLIVFHAILSRFGAWTLRPDCAFRPQTG